MRQNSDTISIIVGVDVVGIIDGGTVVLVKEVYDLSGLLYSCSSTLLYFILKDVFLCCDSVCDGVGCGWFVERKRSKKNGKGCELHDVVVVVVMLYLFWLLGFDF